MDEPAEVTQLLKAWASGDEQALEHLLPRVHGELRRLAGAAMRRERPDHTLQTTALVNEAYMRIVDQKRVRWQDRAHFLAIAAQMMRRVLTDHARKRQADKRGGNVRPVTIDDERDLAPQKSVEVLELDEALAELSKLDARQGKVVELRYFGGLSNEEIGEVLQISLATVKREWSTAKAWLYRRLRKA